MKKVKKRDSALFLSSLNRRRISSGGLGLALLGIFMLVATLIFVLSNYYVKAYSDPMNWLNFATHIQEKFATSYWPLGYPVFLWAAMHVTGPYYIFLVNLPVMLLLAVLTALFAVSSAKETEKGIEPMLIGVGCLAMIMGFDSRMLVYLSNPYRDPLSFVLMLVSMFVFADYIRSDGRRWVSLGVSGLLLGFAYCVRETSVLLVLPLFVYGIAGWMRKKQIGFWKSGLVFGAGILMGALPLFVQSYCHTRHFFLPPQSVVTDNLLPGLHVSSHTSTARQAVKYFFANNHIVYTVAAFCGVVFSVVTKNRKLLLLLVPAVVVYYVFYSYYETFVERYFYVVVVLGAPLAAFGLYKTAEYGMFRLKLAKYKTHVYAAITVLLCVSTIITYVSTTERDRNFRIKDAIALTDFIEDLLPAGSFVLCERHLCEVLNYFTHCESQPCSNFCTNDWLNEDELFSAVDAMMKQRKSVFAIGSYGDNLPDRNIAMLSRLYSLVEVGDIKSSDYGLEAGVCGSSSLKVYKIERWPSAEVSQSVRLSASRNAVLRIDAGSLWEKQGHERTFARLYMDGLLLDDHVEGNLNFYDMASIKTSDEVMITLKSDQPVRPLLDAVLIPDSEIMCLDFGEKAVPSCDYLLSEEFFKVNPSRSTNVRALLSAGRVYIPVPWRRVNQLVFAEFVVRPVARIQDTYLDVLFRDASGDLIKKHRIVADNRKARYLSVPLVFPDNVFSCPVVIEVKSVDASGNDCSNILPDVLDLDNINLRMIEPSDSLDITIGADEDFVYVVDGFYSREKFDNNYYCRWTGCRAVVALDALRPSAKMNIEISCIDGLRPDQALPEQMHVAINGNPLELHQRPEVLGAASAVKVFAAEITGAIFKASDNELVIESMPWRPSDFGAKGDERELGVMMHRIRISAGK